MPGEFEFIDNLKSKYSLDKVGDDCAVLPKDAETDLLLTADMLVEEVDFLLEWTTPEFLGHKALAVSLSDIAAMGGNPVWSMVSIGVPQTLWDTDFLDRFYAGWFKLANEYGVELVGGDVSRSPDKLFIDSIGGGEVPKGRAVMRSGARVGDQIFVTGSLGGAAAGLFLLQRGSRFAADREDSTARVLLKQLKPDPQVDIANLLQTLEIPSAMIDISDGLSSDLLHLAKASGVGCRLDSENIPIDEDIAGFPATGQRSFWKAFHGGEDFQLIFTASEEKFSRLESANISRIGEVTANVGIIELTHDGKTEILRPEGYRHFE